MQFTFENFRSFQNSGAVSILPLNFLIGENSAGKTSFLAGCRFIIELMRGSSTASFNKDPFYLGAYDQIAHYRGGKGGRASSFTIKSHARVKMDSFTRMRRGDLNELRNCELSITFHNKYSQPSIKSVSFTDGITKFTYNEENSIEITVGGRTIELSSAKISEYDNLNFPADTSLFSLVFIRRAMMIARTVISASMQNQEVVDVTLIETIRTLEYYANGFREYFSKRVFASAPVRTRPDRIYTPTELNSSPEGNHTPNSLIKLKRFSPEEWDVFKKSLEKFGISSGLYNTIDLKSLGKSGSDPFQIMVSNGGPQRNLMDVGYGISQSIPVVAEVLSSKGSTLFLFQQPEVHLHPRAQAALGTFFAENVGTKRGNMTLVETHSDYLIDRVRYEIRHGKLDHRLAQILYFSRERLDTHIDVIKFDKSGDLVDVPDGYRDFFLEETRRNFS